jgi:glycosyltransferase involved in cell wall biosynthesis
LKKAIVSVINDLVTDQRVDRTCMTLVKLGFTVLLVGRRKKNSYDLPERKYRMHRFRMIFEKGPLFYAFYNIRLFFLLLFKKADLLFANDLDTLLPNYLVSRVKNIPLVYDSHEYFTEVPELVDRPFVQKTWKRIEGFVFPKLKDIITVNESIAQLYKKQYHKTLSVVRNVSPRVSHDKVKSRKDLGLPEDKHIIILQGAGINIDRGSEEALAAMEFIDNAILLIVGDGDVIPMLKEKAKEARYKDKVMFIPKQPFAQLFEYTVNAEIGLTLDKDSNINYRFSLPNKIFDYIHAGIPILASPLTEVKHIIDEFQIGCTIETHDAGHIADKMKFMLSDINSREMWKKNLTLASEKLNWENEELILLKVLQKYA